MPSESSPSKDYSWQKAKALWILIIVVGTLFALYILYKATRCILRRWHSTSNHIYSTGLLRGNAIDATTTPRCEDDVDRDGDVTRPAEAVPRRQESSHSILPRYEVSDKDIKCGEEVEVEKRGRYTYAMVGRCAV
ncbi:hypothetical protein PTTW11_04396 [Pyrenophora teres f. teres]|uniref:Uncharacterized protein n=1 Tax=Pyrenophora teres f. teres TaxID=97479 RepID=A0A6S6VZ28_9PLEO|nr:hypothetical protein PTTW11_04396 [Pyrenophora teres f. teres]